MHRLTFCVWRCILSYRDLQAIVQGVDRDGRATCPPLEDVARAARELSTRDGAEALTYGERALLHRAVALLAAELAASLAPGWSDPVAEISARLAVAKG